MTGARKDKPTIAIATSTRADWGLLSPLAKALSDEGAHVCVIASNMHLLNEAGHTIDEIRTDGFEPAAEIAPGDSAETTLANTICGTADALQRIKPDCLILLGDRYEMLATAEAALINGVPIVHIAGGTVSEGAFDDSIRHAISKLSSLHFPETEDAGKRLLQMGEAPENVVAAGALGVWNLRDTKLLSREELSSSIGFQIDEDTLLVTLHAATLDPLPPSEQLQNLLDALDSFPHNKVIFTHPNNDVDPRPLISMLNEYAEKNPDRAIVVPSLGRIRYLSALKYVGAVVGNSSSGLVEVPSAGIPTLNIGIRQQGRDRGPSVVDCASDVESIRQGIEKVLGEDMKSIAAKKINPYSRTDTLPLMVRTILSYDFTPYPRKVFHTYS